MTRLLSVENAHIAYGKVEAVRGVSLDVNADEIVTIVGANGAGKTTLLNAIMGILPLSGSVVFSGQQISRLDIEDRVAAGLCIVPEHRELFGPRTVEENLQLGGFRVPRAKAASEKERVFALFPRLKERRTQLAGTLSGGEQQMVAIGRALMGRPELLLLDEPSVGIAPRLKGLIFDSIQQIRKDGTAILIVEQDATSTLKITDRVYVLEHGRTIREGTAKEIAGDKYIQQVYLGV